MFCVRRSRAPRCVEDPSGLQGRAKEATGASGMRPRHAPPPTRGLCFSLKSERRFEFSPYFFVGNIRQICPPPPGRSPLPLPWETGNGNRMSGKVFPPPPREPSFSIKKERKGDSSFPPAFVLERLCGYFTPSPPAGQPRPLPQSCQGKVM